MSANGLSTLLSCLLLVACAQEHTYVPDVAPCAEVASCSQSIHQRVKQQWFKPLGLTGNHRVEYLIELDEQFNIKNLALSQGSGLVEFDKSAELAIRRAEPFVELSNLPDAAWQDNFSKFYFVFANEQAPKQSTKGTYHK